MGKAGRRRESINRARFLSNPRNTRISIPINRPSMGTVGDAYDNAMAESFFATLECELLDRRVFKTKAEARTALFSYIEAWYNPRRRHGSIGYLAPTEFERRNAKKPTNLLIPLTGDQTSPAGA